MWRQNIEHVIDVLKDPAKIPKRTVTCLNRHHVDTSKYEQIAGANRTQTSNLSLMINDNDLNPFWQAVEEHWFLMKRIPKKIQEQEQDMAQDGQSAQEKPDEKST